MIQSVLISSYLILSHLILPDLFSSHSIQILSLIICCSCSCLIETFSYIAPLRQSVQFLHRVHLYSVESPEFCSSINLFRSPCTVRASLLAFLQSLQSLHFSQLFSSIFSMDFLSVSELSSVWLSKF